MVADALTKGSIDMDALLKAMSGVFECVRECKVYSKRAASSGTLSATRE